MAFGCMAVGILVPVVIGAFAVVFLWDVNVKQAGPGLALAWPRFPAKTLEHDRLRQNRYAVLAKA